MTGFGLSLAPAAPVGLVAQDATGTPAPLRLHLDADLGGARHSSTALELRRRVQAAHPELALEAPDAHEALGTDDLVFGRFRPDGTLDVSSARAATPTPPARPTGR